MAGEATDPNSWMNAGASATAAPPTTPAQSPEQKLGVIKAINAQPSAAQPQTTTPSTPGGEALSPGLQYGAGPKTFLRPKRGGLVGVIDKIADAMTGTTRPDIYTDDQGNEFVYHPYLSRGQQWARIGAGMFKGAAAGLAAGRGAGNMGKAALAGVETAEQAAKEQQEREETLSQKAQKDMLNRANMTMLRMQMVEQAWRAARLQTDANQADAKASRENVDFYVKTNGGQVIGHAAHPGDLGTVMGIAPDIAADFVKRHIIEPVDTVDEKGHTGVTFIKMPNADWRNGTVPSGTTFPQFNPSTGQIEEQQASDAMTMGQLADQKSKAFGEKLKYDNDQQELKTKKAQEKEATAKATETEQMLPLKKETEKATAAEKRAGAQKDIAEAGKAKSETLDSGGINALATETPVNGVRVNYLASLPPAEQATIKEIGEGRGAPPPTNARSPQAMKLRQQVNLAYPGYDETRFPTYKKTREDFAAGGQQAMGNQALNNAMEHMQVMYDSASWLAGNPITGAAMRAYGNQRAIDLKDSQTALVDELGKAYKNGVITQGEREEWKNRIDKWSPREVQGNARAFIKLLKGKIDSQRHQFQMGSPPGAIAPMEFMSPQAKAAWVHINAPAGATHVGKGTADGKDHYLGANGQDMGVVEYEEQAQ